MENQDNLFNQIKAAADNAESPNFASMEKVWNRVEEKLDTKILKKESNLWKKIAVAASVLLAGTLGYQFLKNDSSKIEPNTTVISQKDTVTNLKSKDNTLVLADSIQPGIRKNAAALLQKQIGTYSQMAVAEETSSADAAVFDSVQAVTPSYFSQAATEKASNWENNDKETMKKDLKSKEVEVFINKENKVSANKKEEPLLVVDDKVRNIQSIGEINAADIDSLVVLKEPLYIINGIYYTEQQLFGPNPTSPYAPLNKQDIESVEILQDEKAVAVYGEKGKKGVVIIATKNGKPKKIPQNPDNTQFLNRNKK